MMPGVHENDIYSDKFEELNTPVVTLKNGLPISELISNHPTEFEIMPDENEEIIGAHSAESYFNFDEMEKVLNLDVIGVDEDEDGSPFDKLQRKMTNLREDGKLKKFLVEKGVGPLVPDNCIVFVRYFAYVEYNEVPFDSTLWQQNAERDLAIPFDLGRGELISGLHEAILSMRKGEKAEFLVHPDLAYGKLGCPPRIPGDATILFIVEIDKFVDCGDIHSNNDDLSMEEQNVYSNVRKIANGYYMIANNDFKQENYNKAVNKYRQVITMMHNARLATEEEEKERNHFLIKNYTNACVCYHKLRNFKKICTMAADAMRVDESKALKNYKLLYFWGVAKSNLGDLHAAKQHLLAAKKILPQDREIANALKDLEQKRIKALQQEKIMMEKAFSFSRASEVKITEIDEAEEEFRNKIREQLQEFKEHSCKDSLTLKDHFTREEETICVKLAKDLGLYARVIDGEIRRIHIKKPQEM